jgi:hypothetical protein
MKPRLLIINGHSAYFAYVPMGTFGLCDYLNQRNIPVQIVNPALYNGAQMAGLLDHHLKTFRPTHVGLTFHWQETAEGVLRAGEYVRSRMGDVKIVCGGFTAGYFGEGLLEKWHFVDYVIKGDPEMPLERLLRGADAPDIPNLIYRDGRAVKSSKLVYCIDDETISSLSFCTLHYLRDYELYVRTIETKLGFPVFVGRGCRFNCDYCGGGRQAFRRHSGRDRPVMRSIDSILADLRRLKEYTREIYLCYETDPEYIKDLFDALSEDETLMKVFRLNYGAWDLLDEEFLDLYEEVFITDREKPPLFEISPEVFNDAGRRKVKHDKAFSIRELRANLALIDDVLAGGVKVYLFFSRYHDTATTYAAMQEEIYGIFQLKHALFAEQLTNVKIYYDHLSTDVASHYWESYVDESRDLNTLMSWTNKLKRHQAYKFPVNNLLMYTPRTLSEEEIERCELLIRILKKLETYTYELFHVLFNRLDRLVIELIEKVIQEIRSGTAGNPFESLDITQLLHHLQMVIAQDASLLARIPFIEDLIALQVSKVESQHGRKGRRSADQTETIYLNPSYVSVHNHDYLHLSNFLKRLSKENPNDLKPEKTAFVFLEDEILSMPYATYRLTLKEFEKGICVKEYYTLMDKKKIFNPSYHEQLTDKLLKNDVLI